MKVTILWIILVDVLQYWCTGYEERTIVKLGVDCEDDERLRREDLAGGLQRSKAFTTKLIKF